MAIRDALASLFGRREPVENVEWLGPAFREMVLGLTSEELYRTQPYLRIVLDFVARNVAHLGLPVFERVDDTDRRRLREDPIARLLARPNESMTRYELLESLVLDLGLYDTAYWLVGVDDSSPSGWTVQPIPPSWVVGHSGGSMFAPAWFTIARPDGTRIKVSAEDMLVFHGWNPGRPKVGASPVETLKQVLAEQVQAWSYREQVWQRGGRAGTVISRPAGVHWSDSARERFVTDWKARWTGKDGSRAGGTPILEDGMTINRLGFSAREEEWAEVSKVALSTVASVYHVNPVMVGVLDNANFSNTREFRKMLYSETLGPLLAMIEDRLNTFLVPRVAASKTAYVEFNIEEKLQGDFEEQGKILSTSTGAPWMTRNEARALRNLPAIEGGDELVTPLNVLTGGQASPQDGITAGGGGAAGIAALDGESAAKDIAARVTAATALIRAGFDPTASLIAVGLDPIQHLGLLPVTIQKPVEPEGSVDTSLVEELAKSDLPRVKSKLSVKADPGAGDALQLDRIMVRFFARQRSVVLPRLSEKSREWWDQDRWNKELADELEKLLPGLSTAAARAMLTRAGIDPGRFSEEQTLAFLRAVAESRAGAINATTRAQLEAILAGEGPDGVTDPAHVFDLAESSRSEQISVTIAGMIAAFATFEAGKQTGATTKTWLVTSTNPRSEHAAMNGETVGIEEVFSNGANWPGDPVLGAEGVANCRCEVEVTYGREEPQ